MVTAFVNKKFPQTYHLLYNLYISKVDELKVQPLWLKLVPHKFQDEDVAQTLKMVEAPGSKINSAPGESLIILISFAYLFY